MPPAEIQPVEPPFEARAGQTIKLARQRLEGRLDERAALGVASGGWLSTIDSVNSLIDGVEGLPSTA